MKIALVDDEPEELNYLMQLIKKQLPITGNNTFNIDTFYSGKDFLDKWKPEKYDLIVLDIYLNDITGIETARKIREMDSKTCLVFCTSSNDFASESYEVNAGYYILKPFSEENIINMLSHINLNTDNTSSITLPDGQEILLKNIIFTEYSNHIVTIHNKTGGNAKTRISHGSLEEILCSYPYFYCCSKGIIVNFYEVTSHDKDIFIMSNGSQIPISRRKSKDVQNAYIKFCFEKMRKEIYL